MKLNNVHCRLSTFTFHVSHYPPGITGRICAAFTLHISHCITFHTSQVVTHFHITLYISVFQPFQWSGTLFDCSWNPWLFGGLLRSGGPKFEAAGRERETGSRGALRPAGFGADPQPQIHFGPTKSLENASSGRKCLAQFKLIFYWAPAVCGTLGYHWRNPLGSGEPWLKNTAVDYG